VIVKAQLHAYRMLYYSLLPTEQTVLMNYSMSVLKKQRMVPKYLFII